MNKLKKIFYELISGPLSNFKIAILISFLAFNGIIAGLLFISKSSSLAILIGFGYLSFLITLVIIIQFRASAKLNDLHFQLSLQSNMQNKGYDIDDFYVDGAAANPSLLLLLLKCLQMSKPRKILELGSGQTTKLLSCYYRENPDTYILTLEQDKHWAEILIPYISRDNKCHDYRFAPLRNMEFVCSGTGNRIKTKWFDGVDDLFIGNKFNLILVDGPNGSEKYSRAGILQYLPEILDKSFIIIFDDAERYGEIMTIKLLARMLKYFKIDHVYFEVNGIKRQSVFCSKDYGFIQYT